jgi:hypothetical protein
MYTFSLSSDRHEGVVCEPRQVWTVGNCFGFFRSVMSKMRDAAEPLGLTVAQRPRCRSRSARASARRT